MSHRTSFHISYGDTILFPSWVIYSKKEAFLSSLILVVLGIAYQALKYVRVRHGRKCPNIQCKQYILHKNHIIQTALYMIQFVGGYILMLAIMSYNVWLLVGGVIGLGLGYFFFGWMEEDALRPVTMATPASQCGRAVTLDCGFQGKEQELQPLSTADGGDVAAGGSIACTCNESET